jgi:hypothetical protein
MAGLSSVALLILGVVVYWIGKNLKSGSIAGPALLGGIATLVAAVILWSYSVPSLSSANVPTVLRSFPILATPQEAFQFTALSWGALMLLIVAALITVILFTTLRTRDLGRGRFALAGLALLFVIGLGLAGFLGVRSPGEMANRFTPPAAPSPMKSIPADAEMQATEIIEKVFHDSGKLTSQKSLQKVPEWTQQTDLIVDQGQEEFVVTSQRFATIEEARTAAWSSLASRLASPLQKSSPEVPAWTPTLDQIREAGIIKRECEISWPIEVGDFTEQVHQVCWQVELSPQSAALLNVAHRPVIVRQRVTSLAVVLGALTLLLGASAVLLRP